jgi:hypothetical protein
MSTQCESFVEQAQTYLDGVVVNGTDHELFIASYLTGHFAVVVGQAQIENDMATLQMSMPRLNEMMLNSLNAAFLNNELEQDEQHYVFELWDKITADFL